MLGVKAIYLSVYNSTMAICWALVAVQVLRGIHRGCVDDASADLASLAAPLQLISLLETVHAATGLVKSQVTVNLMQWLGRAHALFVVVEPEASLRSSPYAVAMLLAWGVGEACRYPMCVPSIH